MKKESTSAQSTEQAEEFYKITVPSGREMEVRLLHRHFFLISGELPFKLLALAVSGKKDAFQEKIKSLSYEEQGKVIAAQGRAIQYVCVNPKVVLEPQNENEISYLELTAEDLDYIYAWSINSMGGVGGEAQGAESFR